MSSTVQPTWRAPLQKAAADGVGTAVLVFAGCGAIVVDASTGALGHLGVSLAFGLVVGAMVFATGHVSGAHLNPAVTLAFASQGRFPWREVPLYVLAQLAGACIGAIGVAVLLGTDADLGATHTDLPWLQAASIEAVFTGFLMFVITAVATDARAQGQLAALAIGGTVALGALVGGPLTGASMNPARSLGPALVAGGLGDQLLYVVGPIVGALVGIAAYRLVGCDTAPQDVAGCC